MRPNRTRIRAQAKNHTATLAAEIVNGVGVTPAGWKSQHVGFEARKS